MSFDEVFFLDVGVGNTEHRTAEYLQEALEGVMDQGENVINLPVF